MKILRKDVDINLIGVGNQNFKTDAGWQQNINELEKEALEQVINPIENYETNRFINSNYVSDITSINQNDIWYYFYFLNVSNYSLDYNNVGINNRENSLMLKQSTESFFSLEFYKTIDDSLPDRTNRKLVFTKTIPLPMGEKYFYVPIKNNLFKPVFQGTIYKNTEILFLYWFNDETVLEGLNLTGNTFWVTAKFYNAKDGSVIDFVNKNLSQPTPTSEIVGKPNKPIIFYEKGLPGYEISENDDLYYKLTIDRNNFSYYIERY